MWAVELADHIAPAARGSVSCRDGGGSNRPGYGEIGVVEGDGEVFARVVRAVDPVADVGGRRQGLEAVQEAARHVQMAKIPVVEPNRHLIAEGRRVGPNVDHDVMHGAVGAPNQLGFTMSRAAVHAANGSLHRARLGILDERRAESGRTMVVVEHLRVERAGEEAAVVEERRRDEYQEAGDAGLPDLHEAMLP